MANFYFDKSYFGTPFYLLCWSDGRTSQSQEKPHDDDGWFRIGSPEVWTLSKLYGFTVPRFPPQRFQRFFRKEKGEIPWNLVMPAHAYKKEVKKVVSQMKEILCDLDLTYYNKFFVPQSQIFRDLKPAKIDASLLMRFLSAPQEDKQSHLRSFMPENGFASVPRYSRIGTRTGRLKVKRGPMILNVKKEHRRVLTSRFPGGSVWQLDYSSLEPRILLAVSGMEDIPQDIYQAVIDAYKLDTVPRQAVKEAVLSRIYGAADHTIEEQLKDLVDYPADVLALVDEWFHIDELRQKLSSEFSINDGRHITNHYGRQVISEGSALYVLLNYFIQSTGVDVCLLGFNQVVSKIKEAGIEQKILPLYVLHDALFVDVHPDYEYLVPKLAKVGSRDIPKFENTNFYLQAAKEV